MQNPSPQSYSYGNTNSTSSLLRKAQSSFPLPIPTIPEESDAKEKQSFDGNLPNSKTARNKTTRHSTLTPGGLSDRSLTDNRSVMIQNNAGFSILKSSNQSNASLIDSINAKKMKRFGTFAEGNQNSIANTSTSTFAHSPSSNTNSNVKFLEKSDWCMDNQCFLCTRTFSKMNGVFEHHCRVCGNAVCGECSSKKINDNRACESCFYKSTHARAEERRKDQLKSKNATMKTYKKQLMREKEDLTQLIQKRYDLDKKVKEDKEEQNKTIESLQKEKEKAAEVLTKKTDTNVMLKKSLDVDKNFLKEKEVEYEELRNKINSLNLQVMQRKNNYESKKEELQRLFRQKMKYEESPSFVGLMNSLPENDMGSFQDANASTLSVGLTNRLNFRGSSKYSTKG